MRHVTICLFTMFLVLMGCSGGSNTPVSPQGNGASDTLDSIPIIGASIFDDGSFDAVGMFGEYELTINPEDSTAELTAKRIAAIGEDYIVSGVNFFTIAPCATCLKISGIAIDMDGNAVLTFSIRHPFPAGNTSEPPSAANRLDLDVFDLAMVIVPSEATATTYSITGKGVYTGYCINPDGYTTELADVVSDTAAMPFFLAVDDSDTGTSTFNKFAMGEEDMTFDAGFDLSAGVLSFDMYLTMGYGFSAKRPDRLQPKYYNPEFNRKAAWKVVVTPPEGDDPPEMANTWNDMNGTDLWPVTVEVYDWQQGATVYTGEPLEFGDAGSDNVFASSEIASVSVEIPGMNSSLQSVTIPDSGTGHPLDPCIYTIPIANQNLLAEGEYVGLVKVTDERAVLTPADGRDFLIDTPNGIELINYEMPEYATYQTFTATVVIGNQAPIIDSGVDGDDTPFILATDETYTVVAHDPDLDVLTYSWTVTDLATMAEVISDDPGYGDGTIDIDFATIGAALDDQYDIDCDVSDGIAAPVPATTLTVTCNNVLFFDDMESGEGEWLTSHTGPNNGWSIVAGGNGNWWHSNGGSSISTSGGTCSKLWTPEITIPAGISECHLEIYHRATGIFSSNTVFNGPALVTSSNDGVTANKVVFPVISGPQYSNWTYPYTSVYHFGMAYVCNPFNCWGVPAWTSVTTTTTSVVDLSDPSYTNLIGQTLRIGFIYGQGLWYTGDLTWGVDDVKITVTP
ncbi:hypothetical protein J7L05_01375 [bacterium]|nr:hypothetical protein [bacterium]